MEQRFLGQSRIKVDGKGRMSIPAKFRRVLQLMDRRMTPGGSPRLYIAYGDPRTNVVLGLSGDAYDEIDAMIKAEPLGSEVREILEYLYYGMCDEVAVDDAGRLVLPAAAREKLELEDEVVFLGKGDKFEIFKPKDGAAAVGKIEAMLAALGQGNEHFNPLSMAGKSRHHDTDGT